MLSLRSVAVISTVSASVGYLVGRDIRIDDSLTSCKKHRVGSPSSGLLGPPKYCKGIHESETETGTINQSIPSWYKFLPTPFSVSAASAPLERSSLPLPATSPSAAVVSSPTNRVAEIMKFGYPNLDNVRFYEDYVVAYDRRNRTAHWVFEHITGDRCSYGEGVTRDKCDFKEDESMHPYFRATKADYKGSGYDKGHLAAASNHRHSQKAMDQTFLLSNVAPQVGVGFNRGAWNNLEKYTRAIARKSRCVYVCTGPLYLPRREMDGKQYMHYEVIGANHVAVPTHFFKVLVIEDDKGQYEMKSFVMPNQPLPEGVQLKAYYRPVESIERAAGFLLFEKIPKKAFKLINGEKPR